MDRRKNTAEIYSAENSMFAVAGKRRRAKFSDIGAIRGGVAILAATFVIFAVCFDAVRMAAAGL